MSKVFSEAWKDGTAQDLLRGEPTPDAPTSEAEERLKAWVHWALLNPINEDQKLHAEATRDVLTRLAAQAQAVEELKEETDAQDKFWINAQETIVLKTKKIIALESENARLKDTIARQEDTGASLREAGNNIGAWLSASIDDRCCEEYRRDVTAFLEVLDHWTALSPKPEDKQALTMSGADGKQPVTLNEEKERG